MLSKKKFFSSTYIKYFFSYLIIFTVMIIGFYFIIRTYFVQNYLEQRSEQVQMQLENLADQLNDDILSLTRLDSSIISNNTLLLSRYQHSEGYSKLLIYKELGKYISSSKIINSIIYLSKITNELVTTNYIVTYSDGEFSIQESATSDGINFNPSPYFNTTAGKLIYLSNGHTDFILYFPAIAPNDKYIFFYTLDVDIILSKFKNLNLEEITSIALIDKEGQIVTAINGQLLEPYMSSVPIENGIYTQNDSSSVCVCTGINNNHSIVALLSNDYITSQLNATFISSYFTLVLLCMAGFILILIVMKFTYNPLRDLAKKLVPDLDPKQNYLNQLDNTFTENREQNRLLQEKLNNYRLSIHKSLFDSMLAIKNPCDYSSIEHVDFLFDCENSQKIAIIKMSCSDNVFPINTIKNLFENVITEKNSCVLIDSQENKVNFLIHYADNKHDIENSIKDLLTKLNREKGYLSAISNFSTSPLEIPSLYENAAIASTQWPRTAVVDYCDLPLIHTTYTDFHDQVNILSAHLKRNRFSDARITINTLFQKLEQYTQKGDSMLLFFDRYILIDIVTVIVECMNQEHISFHNYSNLFFEVLYYCRGFSFTESTSQLQANIHELLTIYEQKITEKTINANRFKQIIEQHYCDPNFSITILASQFNMTANHMSILFKKELNVNFSDYLWTLRLNKAKELLETSDMSIDDISIKVGYVNTSSFRRKFKQETGLTPLQYRTEIVKGLLH